MRILGYPSPCAACVGVCLEPSVPANSGEDKVVETTDAGICGVVARDFWRFASSRSCGFTVMPGFGLPSFLNPSEE